MTATAYLDDLATSRPVPSPDRPARPDLRVLPGGGQGGPAPAAAPAPVTHERSTEQRRALAEQYRRRRFVVALALSVAIVVVGQALGFSLTSFSSAAPATDDVHPVVHVVRPGDTYAAIAADLGADDPARAAALLADRNGGAVLLAGERLVIDRSLLTS